MYIRILCKIPVVESSLLLSFSPKAQFYLIPNDGIEREIHDSIIGEERRCFIDSVVTPTTLAKLEQIDVSLYNVIFTVNNNHSYGDKY